MRLTSVRVQQCFGFDDSGDIDFSSSRPFFYLVGRNSSGKSSLLNAVRHLEIDVTPADHPNFANFNSTTSRSVISASFQVGARDLGLARFSEQLRKALVENGLEQLQSPQRESLEEGLVAPIVGLYDALLKSIRRSKTAVVKRQANGQYLLGSASDDDSALERRKKVRSLLFSAAPNDQVPKQHANNQPATLTFSRIDTEQLMFLQFPKIFFMNEEFSLTDDLPDRINQQILENDQNDATVALVDLLGATELQRFLAADDPAELDELLRGFQATLDDLQKAVNSAQRRRAGQSLIQFLVHEKNGLQLTIKTDKKPSFYRHLSPNTKILIAYHLHTRRANLKGAIRGNGCTSPK